ncbi:hypothetical protein EYF80_012461 [Liparis tanakae]|uniref:Uncharacterized protein n=1 Tax=Liparis tanakae TaxID=230148 RepID=A0A4Z2IHU5_9TELE|nr:hypothetical protein EYF80_012461 [Liparis tanakae]
MGTGDIWLVIGADFFCLLPGGYLEASCFVKLKTSLMSREVQVDIEAHSSLSWYEAVGHPSGGGRPHYCNRDGQSDV